ncbi:MAG: 50S ribosomal protein L30 [Saprospiraceae bacterium]|jgi:large subunit ribosomal protein L30|nr:50S ribosomal protein L30 [Candidatus Opimibacter skivensis]MBL0006316.1 50S ribosomal protein L30 [Candidatus Opimibacter skivensis]MBP6680101.1 50S ribosomal protein L30 [Saprospiraceae bacterium]HSF88849.1 50S ribosomal protein L30 [Saprospiraceae bacterium]
MSKIKVTQIKSQIDRPQSQKDTMVALGLGKINKSRIHESNPQIQGMIDKVAHMLKVEHLG